MRLRAMVVAFVWWLAAASLAACVSPQRDVIDVDEQIVLFPTDARLDAEHERWTVEVHAWVFELETDSRLRRVLLAGLAATLDLPGDAPQSALFRERARPFLADNEGGKTPMVRVAGLEQRLSPTGGDGHSHTRVELPLAAAAEADADGDGWIPLEVVLAPGDARRFEGRVRLLPADGLSVISDIDDTVKISDVLHTRRLLARTFLEPFEAVPGMADVYATWQQQGAAFHYLSSSPWQLLDPLQAFFGEARLPDGPLCLRGFHLPGQAFAELFDGGETSFEHKRGWLTAMLDDHPGRRFLLVGDSGERDPEVYGAVARKHPGRVAHILIRNVTGEPRDAERYARAFAGVPPERWLLFREPAEIPPLAELLAPVEADAGGANR